MARIGVRLSTYHIDLGCWLGPFVAPRYSGPSSQQVDASVPFIYLPTSTMSHLYTSHYAACVLSGREDVIIVVIVIMVL